MPQLKTKAPTKPQKSTQATAAIIQHPSLADASDLISIMLDYEATARKQSTNLASGRFAMLTASERQMLRAELVADYIRLSAQNMGTTPGAFEFAIESFCSKICDMNIPSHELIGTYLAAVDIVTKGEYLSQVSGLIEAIRATMVIALHGCVETMKARSENRE